MWLFGESMALAVISVGMPHRIALVSIGFAFDDAINFDFQRHATSAGALRAMVGGTLGTRNSTFMSSAAIENIFYP